MTEKPKTPRDILTELLIELLSFMAGVVGTLLVTGLLLASWYQADTTPIRDSNGRELSLYEASSAVVDAFGDTTVRKGELYTRLQIKDHRDSVSVDRKADKPVFGSGVSVPNSWYSINILLEQRSLSGHAVRYTHSLATSLLVACCLCMIILLIVDGYRNKQYRSLWNLVLMVYASVLTTAWLGSVLPWDDRSRQAFGIGTHILDSYVPILGPLLSGYVWGREQFHEPGLMRVFILHSMVFVPLLGWSLMAVKKRITRYPLRMPALLAGIVIPIVCSFFVNRAKNGGLGITMRGADIHPEWYFGVPYRLLAALPEDFAVFLLAIGVVGMIVFGNITPQSAFQKILRMLCTVVIAVFIVTQFLVFIAAVILE